METEIENYEKSKGNVNIQSNQQPQIKFIRCPECGEKIIMVPTLGEMIEAIDNHVSTHRKQPHADLTVAHLKTPTIRMELTKQVLQQASDMLDDTRKPSLWL